MLSEEALIVLAALGACGLLALGVAELLWPTRARAAESAEPPAAAPVVSPVEPAVVQAAPVEVETDAAGPAAHPPRVHRTSALVRHRLARGRRPYVRRASVPPGTVEPDAGVAVAEAEVPPRPGLVARCLALQEAGRHADAIVLALADLQRADALPLQEPDTTAALWSAVARARQALGERVEARAALESAIDAATETERPTYQRQLADLAAGVARALLADADARTRTDSHARLTALGQASGWAECATTALRGDGELDALAAAVRARLWPAYERAVVTLVQRQEFRTARRLLREALADPRIPGGWVETFHGLFSTTFSGEIGQLTAQAIRGVQDGREADALAALQRVEALLERLADEAVSADRREEVGRRLSWGYRKLGERRLDAGDHETALEPLLRALGHETDAERQRDTRALLLSALDAIVEARAGEIRALATGGDRDAAIAGCESLAGLLRGAAERGLPAADLGDAFARVEGLLDELAR